MTDPVILPSSKTIVDRSVIQRHLLSDQVCVEQSMLHIVEYHKILNCFFSLKHWSSFMILRPMLLPVQTDPFNRSLLTVEMLIPDHELKRRIDDYLASHSKK